MSLITWYTGNTGAGKSTIADTYKFKSNAPYIILDGDDFRDGLNSDLGFSINDRETNNIRIAHVAKILADQQFDVVVAVIAPTHEIRRKVKEICGCDFIYVEGGAPNSNITPYEIPTEDEYIERIEGNMSWDPSQKELITSQE